jgi:hypothetical protein
LIQFRREYKKGNKYIHRYALEEICLPGAKEPRTVVKQMVKNGIGEMVLEELLFTEKLSSRQLTNGIGGMDTWVPRGHGPLVKPSSETSARNMSVCI